MAAGRSSSVNHQYKTEYRIQNWKEYKRNLRSCGVVTSWLSEEPIAALDTSRERSPERLAAV